MIHGSNSVSVRLPSQRNGSKAKGERPGQVLLAAWKHRGASHTNNTVNAQRVELYKRHGTHTGWSQCLTHFPGFTSFHISPPAQWADSTLANATLLRQTVTLDLVHQQLRPLKMPHAGRASMITPSREQGRLPPDSPSFLYVDLSVPYCVF